MKKYTKSFLAAMLLSIGVQAQKWVDMMKDTNANFYDIVKEFDNYWKDRPYERGHGYKAFKRWQWFAEPRVYPSGNLKYASRGYAYEQYQKFLLEQSANKTIGEQSQISATTAAWVPMGPFGTAGGSNEAGRVQVIRMSPAGTNTYYVGTAAGGFWITTNGGTSYTTTTDQFVSLGVSDIAVSSSSPNLIYISTGDKDGGDTHSTGVLRSNDGGYTWTQTGLSWTTSMQRRIYRLLINPQNNNSLIAATSVGMYKSFDAGATWSLCATGNFQDAEWRPGDTTVVHVVTTSGYYRSNNGGLTYTGYAITGNLSCNRLSLAVTPANNSCAYILVSAPNNGFGGLYRSTDIGSTWSLRSNAPNIFDWSTTGSGSGGQGWYDIAIDASPTNSNEIVAGGVNTWKSTNGGTNWTLNTHWTGGGGKPYVHADCHHVLYVNGTTVYLGTDGGVARTTNSGTSYSALNGNMNIAQIYKMGLSAATPSRLVTGHQDNGSNLLSTGTSWSAIYGGDGMDCFISWNNDNTIVSSYVNGDFRRSTNGGGAWTTITTGLTGSGAWVAPIVQDPNNANTFYCGYQQVFKSTNQGTNWTQIGTVGGGQLDEVKVAKSNSQYIYCTNSGSIYKTSNGGLNWYNITGVVTTSASITDLAISNINPNNIFATLSGYANGQKVYHSTDGGLTWVNYSSGLPNIPVNCIVYKNNSPDEVYVGTDMGVYYRSAAMNAWIPYNTGLPNVVIDDMEIYYPTGKLRAASYGRGVWETSLYSNPAAAPVAMFSTQFSPACVNTALQFYDMSSNTPTSWNWTFTGGSPATSTLQNPVITYPTAGIYTVTLLAANVNGTSTAYVGTISVANAPTVNPIPKKICVGDMANLQVQTNGNLVQWSTGAQGYFLTVSNTVTTIYSFTAYLGACSTASTNTVIVDQPPVLPVIVNMGSYLTTTSVAQSYQWYVDGNVIGGATASSYTPSTPGSYIVEAINGACTVQSQSYSLLTVGLKDMQMWQGLSISPNPAKEHVFIHLGQNVSIDIAYVLRNNLGQTVSEGSLKVDNSNSTKLNVQNLAAGVYYLELTHNDIKNTSKFIKQ